MKIWPIALAVVGLTCLSGGGLVAGFIALDKAGKSQPVTAEDRTLLVTTDDLAMRVESFEVQPQVEKLTKKKGLDSSISLEYEYKPADGTLYLNSSVTTERTASTASTNYASLRVGHGLGFSMSADKETNMEDRNDLFKWGDESHHALITHSGRPVGNLFAARKGRHIYSFMVVGVYFDSTETIGDLLLPKLEQLSKLP
ncbi:MAG TPA: hypothetical protein VF815_10285 [Myxococcaceae bacterium]|jgi:hypothetical protein